MTEQEIIPGKKYKHRNFRHSIYVGEGDVNPDTLDCENRRLRVTNSIRHSGLLVTKPGGLYAIPNFWDHFFPI